MKVVQIPNYGPVTFPDDTPDDEIRARSSRIISALAEQQKAPDFTEEIRNQGLGSLMAGGFKRAATGLGSTVTDLLPALGGAIVGNKEYAREQLAEAAEKKRQAELENPTAYRSYKDVGGVGDAAGYAAETFGELGPDILGLLTGAGVASSVGKRVAVKGAEKLAAEEAAKYVAKRGLTGEAADAATVRFGEKLGAQAAAKGSERGTLAGMYGSSVGLNTGDTFESIYDKTGNLEPGIALAFGAAQGVLDTYLPSKILKQLSPAAKDRLAGELLTRSNVLPQSAKLAVAKELGLTTAGEAGTEGLQEVLGILAEQTAGTRGSLLDPENLDRILNSSIKGAIGGGTFGAPGAILEGRRTAALSREEADRQAEAKGQQVAGTTGLPADIDYNRPAYTRRAGGPQADLFPTELGQARFSLDDVPRTNPQAPSSSYTEDLSAAQTKYQRGEEITEAEARLLQEAKPDEFDLNTAKIAKAEAAPSSIDERQMSFEGMGSVQRPDRRGAAEEGFLSQQPDLLGDMLPQREAEPEAIDPLERRFLARVQELMDSGMDKKQAQALAYQQVVEESQNDNLASLESEPSADPRQGALQFSAPAPEGRGFREEPFNTQMPDQLQEQVGRDNAFRQAEADAAAQKEQESTRAESERQLQLAEIDTPPTIAPIEPLTAEPVQESFPGMGVKYGDKVRANQEAAKAEAAAQVPEIGASGVVTDEMLTGFGVLPAAPLRKRVIGKDLSNESDRAQVQRELTKYAENDAVPAQSRAKVTEFLQSPVFYTQAPMFGPKGGATAAAVGKETKTNEPTPSKPTSTTTGASVSVPVKADAGSTTRGTTTPRTGGVDAGAVTTKSAGVRKEPKLAPLKVEKHEPIAELTPVEERELQEELAAEQGATTEKKVEAPKVEKKTEPKVEKKAEPKVEKEVEVETEAKTEKAKPEAEKETEAKTEKKPAKDITEEESEVKASQAKGTGLFARIKALGYGIDKTDVDSKDVNRATLLKVSKTKLTPAAEAAKLYFSKVPRVVDAFRNIAFDLVYNTPRFRRASESRAEAEFFQGMNGENAKLALEWVRENMSDNTQAKFDKIVQEYERQQRETTDEALIEMFSDALAGTESVDETIQSYLEAQKGDIKKITLDAVQSAGLPLHPSVIAALQGGDTQAALKLLAASTDGPISEMASALLKAKIAPKITIQKNLTDEDGNRVPGYYDPATDTVHLDAEMGLNPHVLFHEFGHAATSHTLDNKSHPLTKQLTQLFNEVKGSLDTAYGAESLDEFVAEAWANDQFKGKLNSINPKGEKITAWQRFVNSVGNFFRKLMGRETKSIESALDVADRLIHAILSPAPEGRVGPLLYVAAVKPRDPMLSRWLDQGADVIAGFPTMNQERADKIHSFLKTTIPDALRERLLSTLPLHALVDVAKNYLPKAVQVDRLVGEKSGDEYKRNEAIEPVVREAEKWAEKNSKLLDTFNRLVYDSTIEEVDPSVPRETYKGDKGKLAQWDAMQPDFEKIGAGGRQVYRRMRDTYKAMYEEIKAAIGAKIDSTEMNADEKAAVKREIYAKLAERGHIAPYFPLTRNGDFWVSYKAPGRGGNPDTYISAFETERERERFIAHIEKQGATQTQRFTKLSEFNYKNVPASSFVNGVLKVMDANSVPTEAREQVLRLFLQTLPETSFAQSFQKRKGTLGFNKDAIRALREKTSSMSRQLTNMKYAAKLTDLRDELHADVKALGEGEGSKDNRLATKYLEELDKRIAFAISPTTSRASQFLSSLGFNWLLGGNISSAVVNLTQVPLVVLPYLGGKYDYDLAFKAVGDAYKMYSRSGFDRTVTMLPKEDGRDVRVKERAMPALDNFDFDNVKDKNILRLRTLAEEATNAGQLNRSMFYDVLDVDNSKKVGNIVNAVSGFAFHHGERMNRQVTLIAAYNLELDRLNKKGAKLEDGSLASSLTEKEREQYAARQAIYMAEMTNGGTSAASAPRIAQGPVGKVLFMFKRYGVSMYYMLYKMTNEALQQQDPAVRKQALKQLAGIYGSAAIFSGLQGLPLFGALSMIYNMFADDDDEDFGTVVRGYAGEVAYKGLVNELTGLDIASRVGLGDLIFRDNKMSSGSASFAETALETLGGPAYGIASKIERGMGLIRDGHTERGIEAMVPSGIGNVMRGIRYATEGANTLRGDPITGDIGPWNSFAQVFGFAPADYTKQLEINARLKSIDKKVNTDKTKFLSQYNVAMRNYDFDGAMEAREKLEALYTKHPGLGSVDKSISSSQAQFNRQTPKMYHGITLSPKLESELRQLAADLED